MLFRSGQEGGGVRGEGRGGWRIRRVISNRFGISFVGDRNVFKLDVDMVVFCMLKLVNFMLCELYLSKTGIKKKEEFEKNRC